jgi:hypothetical protein
VRKGGRVGRGEERERERERENLLDTQTRYILQKYNPSDLLPPI